jgi:uncharacterized FlaG/YvyC family protein
MTKETNKKYEELFNKIKEKLSEKDKHLIFDLDEVVNELLIEEEKGR